MRVIALSTLKAFWENHPRGLTAKPALLAWHQHTLHANWRTPAEVKSDFGTASVLMDGRVVFNIHGNSYRLVVRINYEYSVVYVRFIGTHKEYDQIDVQRI
jgi:mRNA interferase HigB